METKMGCSSVFCITRSDTLIYLLANKHAALFLRTKPDFFLVIWLPVKLGYVSQERSYILGLSRSAAIAPQRRPPKNLHAFFVGLSAPVGRPEFP